jgi:hypothetical protein
MFAAGGMLVGTSIGVLLIPGLYYLFGRISDNRYLLKDVAHNRLARFSNTIQMKQLLRTLIQGGLIAIAPG